MTLPYIDPLPFYLLRMMSCCQQKRDHLPLRVQFQLWMTQSQIFICYCTAVSVWVKGVLKGGPLNSRHPFSGFCVTF